MDILTEKIRFYNVCSAKTNVNAVGEHCNCGFAFPAKMWQRAGDWKFYCNCRWAVLEREGQKDP
eukprot:12921986-Prorocentrum_lima.AAC.1